MMALARDFGGAFVFGLSCLSAGPASAQVAEPGTGVPLELAQARAEATASCAMNCSSRFRMR